LDLLLQLVMIEDGAIAAELLDVETMPDDFADQLAALWRDAIPREVKEILSAGALASTAEGQFIAALVVRALDLMSPRAGREDAVEAAALRYGWLLRHDSVARFAQPQHRDVSANRSELRVRDRHELRRHVARALADLTRSREIDDLPLLARRVVLDTHVRLAQEGWTEDRMAAAEAAYELSILFEELGETSRALSLRRQAIDWAAAAGIDGRELLNLRSCLLRLLQREGRADEAGDLLDELVAASSSDDPMHALWEMSASVLHLAQHGASTQAINALNRQVAAADAIDASGRLAISGHANLAYFLNRLGRHEEALAQYVLVRERCVNTGGSPDTSTFKADVNIAATIRFVEGTDAAMRAFDAIDAQPLTDAERAHAGLARLRTLHAAVGDGDSRDAVRGYLEAAFARARAELGPAHKDVRGTVNVLGNLLLDTERYEDAVAIYERYPAALGLATVDEVDLATSFNYATGLMRLGRNDDALPVLDAVVRGATDCVGEDAKLTRTAVAHLVHAALTAKQVDLAARVLGAWAIGIGINDDWGVGAQQRMFEMDAALADHGRPGVVPALLQPAREFILGEGDPVAVLYLTQWIAGLLGQAGEPEAAMPLAREAAHLAAQLGHDEAFFAAQLTFAECARMTASREEALAAYRVILDAPPHALPADHQIRTVAEQRVTELVDGS
jgi:tetratricopeptide (TPR) repeat protein